MHIARAADTYYLKLIDKIPKEAVKQFRIGYDEDSDHTCVLAIIDHKYENQIGELMDLGSTLDLEMFTEHDFKVMYWVITDHVLDQPLIEIDFPYIRSVSARYEGDTYPLPYGESKYGEALSEGIAKQKINEELTRKEQENA